MRTDSRTGVGAERFEADAQQAIAALQFDGVVGAGLGGQGLAEQTDGAQREGMSIEMAEIGQPSQLPGRQCRARRFDLRVLSRTARRAGVFPLVAFLNPRQRRGGVASPY